MEIIMKEEIIKEYIIKYNLIDFTKYDSLFDIEVRIRGDKLYKNYPFQNLSLKDNTIISNIKEYKVLIEFDNNSNIMKMSCSCPYYESGKNCKHLYALLIESKLKDNYSKLKKIGNDLYDDFLNAYHNVEQLIKERYDKCIEEDKKELDKYMSYYHNNRIPRYKKLLEQDSTQLGELLMISEIDREKNKLIKIYNDVESLKNIIKIKEQEEKKIASLALLQGLFDSSKKETKQNKELEYAKKELLEGNPDYYINEVGYIDDYVVDNFFPLEQEEIDEFDDE
jgi:hypothetical protein